MIILAEELKKIYDDVIFMINDTRLHNGIVTQIPGFVLLRCDKNTGDSTPGGSAIAVPSDWEVEIAPSITEAGRGYEATGVIVTPPGCKPLKLLSLYNHPQNHVSQHLFTSFMDLKHNNREIHGLIAGDLNCSHEAFSSRFTNSYGTSLFNLVNNLNLYVLDNEEPTTFHRGEPNVLDLCICEPRSLQLIQECYVEESVGSDHLPLVMHLSLNSKTPHSQNKPTRKSFDFPSFKEELESVLEASNATCSNLSEVDHNLKNLTDIISNLKEKHTQEKSFKHKRKNLSEETLSWIRLRKDLLKEMKKASTTETKKEFSQLYNRANKVVKNLLDEHDTKEMEGIVFEIQNEKNSSQMWRKFRKFRDQNEPNQATKHPLINNQGVKISDPEIKAEMFASRLEKIH